MPEHRREQDHETHWTRRKEPHRVHARLRKQRDQHSQSAREVAGPELFRKLFRCIVPDNGNEFSDPEMVENYRPDPEHNPHRLLPRGARVFYCDPYCSCQKPHIERFHLDLRRILQKGVSFNPLSQEQVNLIMSHLNSYPRTSLGGRTPYDVFVEEFGDEGKRFLDRLGINGTVAANKPFAAPVQNSKSSKLTFKLGGVNPVAGTGATVTYGVAVVNSPSDTAEPTQYVGVGESIELDVPTTVKYYRIKTKIDQTQANN